MLCIAPNSKLSLIPTTSKLVPGNKVGFNNFWSITTITNLATISIVPNSNLIPKLFLN